MGVSFRTPVISFRIAQAKRRRASEALFAALPEFEFISRKGKNPAAPFSFVVFRKAHSPGDFVPSAAHFLARHLRTSFHGTEPLSIKEQTMKFFTHGLAIGGLLLAVGCGMESSNPSKTSPSTTPYNTNKPLTETPGSTTPTNPADTVDRNPIDRPLTNDPLTNPTTNPPVILPPTINTPTTTPDRTTPPLTTPMPDNTNPTTTPLPDNSTPRSEK
jgi:hypothetical protein